MLLVSSKIFLKYFSPSPDPPPPPPSPSKLLRQLRIHNKLTGAQLTAKNTAVLRVNKWKWPVNNEGIK